MNNKYNFEKFDKYNIDFKAFVSMKTEEEQEAYLSFIVRNRNSRG